MKSANKVTDWVRNFFSYFKNQIIAVFIVTLVTVILLAVFLFYSSTISIIKKDAVDSNSIILSQISSTFVEHVKGMQDLALNPRTDERALSILENGDAGYSDQKYIGDYIKTTFYSRSDITNISVFILANGRSFTFSKSNRAVTVRDGQQIAQETWYRKAAVSPYYCYLEPSFRQNSMPSPSEAVRQNLFTVYRAVIDVFTQRPVAMVAVTYDGSILDGIVNDAANDEQSMVCLMDSTNRVYYANNAALLQAQAWSSITERLAKSKAGASNFPVTVDGRKYIAVCNISSRDGWRIVKLISLDVLNEKTVQSRNYILLFLVVSVAVSVVVIMVIVNALTASLTALSRQMRRAGGGDFKTMVEEKGSYEIVMLAHRYNSMIGQIDELIQKNYIAQINEKTARLRALEAQVDPHFLYNSLQVISTKAIINDQKDIYKMIAALAANLRYTVAEEGTVTVSREMEHIRNYLLLLKARFDERLSVTMRVEENASGVMIPKLSVYTIVENSVKHGLENMMGQMHVDISIVLNGGFLVATVTDDGPGIAPEQLEELHRSLSEDERGSSGRKHIGLYNLNQRIKILYGDSAALDVRSEPGCGTQTRMTLPVDSVEGHDVSSSDY